MSALGFGASGPWAEPWFAEAKARRLVETAWKAGLRHLDTAPSYGGGLAECRLGRVLSGLAAAGVAPQGGFVLSSKVGTQCGEGRRLIKDFGQAAIEAQLSATLSALGTDCLDILYLHGPDKHQLASSLPVLMDAKERGKIRAIGVCTDGASVKTAARRSEVDWLMAPFNALYQDNLDGLRMARAEGKKLAVVAPLAQALWRRDLFVPTSLSDVWYAARALARRRAALGEVRSAEWLRSVPGWSPAALSIAFVRTALSPDLVLTTTTRPAHLQETAAAMSAPIPQDVEARLQGLMVS